MRKTKEFKTLEEGILLLQKEAKSKSISIREILRLLPGKGQALVLIFLSLPFCQPLQIPGLSTLFGLAVALIGVRMAFGKRIWLPKRILSKTIQADTIQKITNKALLLVRKMKRWIHPRLSWVCLFLYMRIIHGVTIFLSGVILALPIPIPLSNLTTAWTIFLIALGLLEDDGLFVLLGYMVFLLTIIFFVLMAFSIHHFFRG